MQLRSDTCDRSTDESARMDHPLEWWFVQGRFGGVDVEPCEFMVSLFRHALEWGGFSAGNACTFIASMLNPASGRHAVLSRADPNTMPFLVKALKHYPPPGLDPQVVHIVAEELSDCGPPRPIHAERKRPRFESRPFRVQWGDFELSQDVGAFVLRFVEAESGRRCHFRLVPKHPRLHLAGVEVPDGGTMDYVSYTRLELQGDVDGNPVTGEAWLDHQWGGQGWVLGAKKKERILGWDWLGIQLDDERELLLMVHRDLKEKKTLCQYGALVNKDGAVCLHEDVILTPTAWWTSPRTDTCYPVEWHIAIPSLQLSLDFQPLSLDQEIPILPPIRAVWEGAGRVSGTMAGTATTGWARLELHGHAYLIDLPRHLDAMIRNLRKHMENVLPRQVTEHDIQRLTGMNQHGSDIASFNRMISTPLWDLMDRGGERHWYSLPVLLMIGALRTDPKPYEELVGVTTDMLRSAAEIIVDIQEQALLRRGDDCIHLRYGTDEALSVANAALFLPISLLADYPNLDDHQRLELYRVITRLCMEAQSTRQQDACLVGMPKPEQWLDNHLCDHILRIYEEKATFFAAAAMECATVIARADDQERAACIQLGRVFGISLQIVKDIAEFDPEHTRHGDGIALGNPTYVIARALLALRKAKRLRLAQILQSAALRHDPATQNEAIELVRKSGALESARKAAREMIEKEWIRFSKVLPASEPKTMLRVFMTFILDIGKKPWRS